MNYLSLNIKQQRAMDNLGTKLFTAAGFHYTNYYRVLAATVCCYYVFKQRHCVYNEKYVIVPPTIILIVFTNVTLKM